MKLLVILSLILIPRLSFAMFNAAAVAGVTQNVGSTTANGTTFQTSPDLALSYGLLGNIIAPSNWGVSFGALYVPVVYHTTVVVNGATQASGDTSAPYYQIPVTVDNWLLGHLGLGLGGYYAISAGNITQFGQSQSFSQAKYQSSDYGLVGKVQLLIPIGILTYLTATVMYDYSLQNSSTQSGLTVTNQGFVALGGVGLSL